MKSKVISEAGGKTYALVFKTGDEVVSNLLKFAAENCLGGSRFTAVGALSEVTLGFYNLEKRDYKRIPMREQLEVLSLVGNITRDQDRPKVHAHIVVGRSDGTAHGGHLLEGRVRPTLEVILEESPEHLWRKMDPASGLALIDLNQ